MRSRSILLTRRREIALPIHYTNGRALLTNGDDLQVNIPSAGILNSTFIVDALAYVPLSGLIAYATEQADEDPWRIKQAPAFFYFNDDLSPREIEIGAIPQPQDVVATREDVQIDETAQKLRQYRVQ